MKTLAELKQAGVTHLQVKGGEAIAVNPYEKYRHAIPNRNNHNLFLRCESIPPIPTSNIPYGTYEIDELEESSYFDGDEFTHKYCIRLKQVKEEEPKGCEIGDHDYVPNVGMDNDYSNYICRQCSHIEGSEYIQPKEQTAEGIEKQLAGKVREHLNSVGYDLSSDTEYLIAQVLRIDGKRFLDSQLAEYKAKEIIELLVDSNAQKQFYEYGLSLGVKINDLQRLKSLANKAFKDRSEEWDESIPLSSPESVDLT